MNSEPECAGILEKRNKSAINMAGHESFNSTQELSADKHRRNRLLLAVAGDLVEEGVDFGAGGVAVELDNGGADTEAEEELLDDVAHAAAGDGEDHHRIAGGQKADPLVNGLHFHGRRLISGGPSAAGDVHSNF